MNSSKLKWWFLIFTVMVVTFSLPAAALAQDGGGSTGNPAQIALPGIFSLLLGSGGTAEGGTVVLGPMQFDLASFNSTAKVEGLKFGNGQFDWDSVSISQNQPKGQKALQVSEAQATVHGPSSGFSSNATAHLKYQPNEAVSAEGTVGFSYDGLAGRLGIMVGNANLKYDTAPVGMQIQNLNTGRGTMVADQAKLTFPATGGSIAVNGVEVSSAGTKWDSLSVDQPEVKLGNNATLSDLTLIVHGPNEGYATEGGVHVQVSAGDLGSVEAQIGLMYDPSSGKFYAALSNGSATLTTNAFSVQLSGISYMGSTLSIDTVNISVPSLRLEGEISGVTVGGGSAVDFQQAWIRYLTDPAAGGSLKGVQFSVQKANGSYVVTTQALVTPTAKQ
jgi:hypothetical protein